MDLFSEFEEPILPFLLPSRADCYVNWDANLNGFEIKVPHGELFYSPSFFASGESDSFLLIYFRMIRVKIYLQA